MAKNLIIRREDIERVVASQPANPSNARAYFSRVVLKNSTHIAAAELKREYGNVPVITRGDNGIVPKHGLRVSDVAPLPVEIDDKISAVHMDELERATDTGRNQIIDEYLSQHAEMVRETVNALCCQAHKGRIDYMMKGLTGKDRYRVDYGEVARITFPKTLSAATLGDAVSYLSQLRTLVTKQGVGGPGEFIASQDVYARFADLLTQAKQSDRIMDGYLMVGAFRVLEDNDSYTDLDEGGNKVTRSLCGVGEVCYRAQNAGQRLVYLRLDDVVQREAVPVYSFTAKSDDQRGENLYTKSKPFPLVNTKGIAWASFKEQSFAVTFTAGANGTISASVGGAPLTSGAEVPAGSTVVFEAKPASTYEVDKWAGASAAELTDLGGNKKSIEVSAAVTVSVSFKSSSGG